MTLSKTNAADPSSVSGQPFDRANASVSAE